MEKNESRFIPINLCAHLVRKYKINANWLFAAEGNMYRNDETVYVGNDILTFEAVNKETKERFCEFIDHLLLTEKIESRRYFYKGAGLPQDSHSKLRDEENRTLRYQAINHAILNYNLNANWIILGIGNMKGS